MKRVIVVTGIVLLAVAGYFGVVRDGSSAYTLEVRLSNAAGLSSGSPVAIGGVTVGTVQLEGRQDHVDATLEIERQYAPIDKRARAAIIARNALGQKQLLLTQPGGTRDPAPSGYKLPNDKLTTETDLDQVLSTLDADTRTRLGLLLNEMGMTVAGRRLDFKTIFRELGPALSHGGDVLGQLADHNRDLGNLLDSSDRFIAYMARERRKVSTVIDLVGRTTESVAQRRLALRDTLRRAPAALRSARFFLAELRRTTGPLGSTARLLTRTAPSLTKTLDQVEPFRAAAAPTLASATRVAPSITRLARTTDESLAGALPALDSVDRALQNEIPSVGRALDNSMDNLLATLENWSRAIQFRDGLSHIFRGEAAFGPSFYERLLANVGATLPAADRRRAARQDAAVRPPATAPAPQGSQPDPAAPAPALPEAAPKLPDVLGLPEALLGKQQRPAETVADPSPLLDFLLAP